MNLTDYICLAITLYLSGCLVARVWVDIMTQDRDIKQVWLSWFYVIETIITWDWKNKQKKNRLGDLSNKDLVILYNYRYSEYDSDFKFIAEKYIQDYKNKLEDAIVYAKYDNTESLISEVRNKLKALENPDNIIEIFKAFWLLNRYNKSTELYISNNEFSVSSLSDLINSSLEDIRFTRSRLCIGTSEAIDFVLMSDDIKGRSLLITINNLKITYKIV